MFTFTVHYAECFASLYLMTVNWITLTTFSYPPMTKKEFNTYVFDYYRAEGKVPLFMEFFLFKIVSAML